jgi:hypothetical protein
VQKHFPWRDAAVQAGDRRQLRNMRVSSSFTHLSCRAAYVDLTIKLPVHKSVPVARIAVRPQGKIKAPSRVMTPGAFSWYHGATVTDKVHAQASARRHPAMNPLTNTLSARMLAFMAPAREHSSVVSLVAERKNVSRYRWWERAYRVEIRMNKSRGKSIETTRHLLVPSRSIASTITTLAPCAYPVPRPWVSTPDCLLSPETIEGSRSGP